MGMPRIEPGSAAFEVSALTTGQDVLEESYSASKMCPKGDKWEDDSIGIKVN